MMPSSSSTRRCAYAYTLFGLSIASDLELPELSAAEAIDPADVIITHGRIGAGPGHGPGVHRLDECAMLVSIEGIGRFRVRDGREITVEPDPRAHAQNVRLYLLGSAFGLLLHQRGLLPLHANAIELEGTAVAFMGPSGEGKSTLAAWFHDRGHAVVADDVCVIRFDERRRPVAAPGAPKLRLWKEALEATGRRPEDFSRAWAGDDTWDKFDVPLQQVSATGLPLRALYLLESGTESRIDLLEGADAARAVIENTYRGAYAAMVGTGREHWESCIALASAAPIFRMVRTRDLARFDVEAERALIHARSLAGPTGESSRRPRDAGSK